MSVLKQILLFSGSLALALAALALLVRLAERRLTFHPRRELEAVPADFGLDCREVSIPSGGGSLSGWLFPPADSAAPLLLVFHGNAGNISHRLEWLAPLVRRGLGALLFDYRGYGRSSAERPTERSFQEDALAVWSWLTDQNGLSPERIVVCGRSLGGAPAVFLAGARPVRALVLEGAFSSGREMAQLVFGYLPLHLAMKNRWEVEHPLAALRLPTLIIHGTADSVVPFRLGQRLAQAARQGQWWPVEGGEHLDAHHILGQQYYDRLERFVRESAPAAAD